MLDKRAEILRQLILQADQLDQNGHTKIADKMDKFARLVEAGYGYMADASGKIIGPAPSTYPFSQENYVYTNNSVAADPQTGELKTYAVGKIPNNAYWKLWQLTKQKYPNDPNSQQRVFYNALSRYIQWYSPWVEVGNDSKLITQPGDIFNDKSKDQNSSPEITQPADIFKGMPEEPNNPQKLPTLYSPNVGVVEEEYNDPDESAQQPKFQMPINPSNVEVRDEPFEEDESGYDPENIFGFWDDDYDDYDDKLDSSHMIPGVKEEIGEIPSVSDAANLKMPEEDKISKEYIENNPRAFEYLLEFRNNLYKILLEDDNVSKVLEDFGNKNNINIISSLSDIYAKIGKLVNNKSRNVAYNLWNDDLIDKSIIVISNIIKKIPPPIPGATKGSVLTDIIRPGLAKSLNDLKAIVNPSTQNMAQGIVNDLSRTQQQASLKSFQKIAQSLGMHIEPEENDTSMCSVPSDPMAQILDEIAGNAYDAMKIGDSDAPYVQEMRKSINVLRDIMKVYDFIASGKHGIEIAKSAYEKAPIRHLLSCPFHINKVREINNEVQQATERPDHVDGKRIRCDQESVFFRSQLKELSQYPTMYINYLTGLLGVYEKIVRTKGNEQAINDAGILNNPHFDMAWHLYSCSDTGDLQYVQEQLDIKLAVENAVSQSQPAQSDDNLWPQDGFKYPPQESNEWKYNYSQSKNKIKADVANRMPYIKIANELEKWAGELAQYAHGDASNSWQVVISRLYAFAGMMKTYNVPPAQYREGFEIAARYLLGDIEQLMSYYDQKMNKIKISQLEALSRAIKSLYSDLDIYPITQPESFGITRSYSDIKMNKESNQIQNHVHPAFAEISNRLDSVVNDISQYAIGEKEKPWKNIISRIRIFSGMVREYGEPAEQYKEGFTRAVNYVLGDLEQIASVYERGMAKDKLYSIDSLIQLINSAYAYLNPRMETHPGSIGVLWQRAYFDGYMKTLVAMSRHGIKPN